MSKQASDFMPQGDYRKALDTSFVHRYSHGEDEWSWDVGMIQAAQAFLESLDARADQHVLDLGVGRGRDASTFILAGHRVTGLDIVENSSWPLLRKRWGDRLNLVNKAVQDWQPAPGTVFDAALDNGCFHHQHPDEWGPYLAHVRRLLRPGALVGLNVFGVDEAHPEAGWREMDNQRQGYFFTDAGIRQTLEAHGFTWQGLEVIERQHGEARYLLALVRT